MIWYSFNIEKNHFYTSFSYVETKNIHYISININNNDYYTKLNKECGIYEIELEERVFGLN
jgi:hypothetical protein